MIQDHYLVIILTVLKIVMNNRHLKRSKGFIFEIWNLEPCLLSSDTVEAKEPVRELFKSVDNVLLTLRSLAGGEAQEDIYLCNKFIANTLIMCEKLSILSNLSAHHCMTCWHTDQHDLSHGNLTSFMV